MQAANRVAKNTAILYTKMGVTVFISLYATRLVLAELGSKDFGLFSVVGGAIAMLGFLNASMSAATQRFMSFAQGAGDIKRVNKIFNMSVLLHLIIALLILFVLEIAGYFFFHGILNIDPLRVKTAMYIYQFMIISTLFSVISVPYDALLNAHENMLFYAILGILESVLKLVIAISIAFVNIDKLLYYGALMAVLSILLLIINRIYCHHKYSETKINLIANYDKNLLKEMSSFAGWSLLGSSSSMVANYGQGIVINMFFGTAVNAAQGVSGQITGQLGAFAQTMVKALNPLIAKSEGAGNRELMLKATLMGCRISFYLLIFFYIPVFIEMPLIFKMWLKDVPQYAIIFCRLLLIRNLIEQLFQPLFSSIAAVGNIRSFQITTSFLNVLPLFVCYLLFSLNYPPYSLYFVYIVYAILNSAIVLFYAKKECDLSVGFFFKNVFMRSVLSLVLIFSLSIVPMFLINESLGRLFIIASISSVAFLIVIWFVGFSVNERNFFVKIIKDFIMKYHFKYK